MLSAFLDDNEDEDSSQNKSNSGIITQLSLPNLSRPVTPFNTFGSVNRFSNLPNNTVTATNQFSDLSNNNGSKRVARQSLLSGLEGLTGLLFEPLVEAYKDVINRRPAPPATNLDVVSQFLRSRAAKPDSISKTVVTRNKFTDRIDDIDRRSKTPVNDFSRFFSLFDGLQLK